MPVTDLTSPFEHAWYSLMTAEGGGRFTDNPSDPGGPTRWGVTLKALREWRKAPSLTAGDVAALSETEAKQICFALYYRKLGLEACRNVPAAILILDQGYNRGVVPVGRQVQTVLLEQLGSASLLMPDALNVLALHEPADNRKFLMNFVIASQKAYFLLAQERPHLSQFVPGWINRTHALLRVISQYCP